MITLDLQHNWANILFLRPVIVRRGLYSTISAIVLLLFNAAPLLNAGVIITEARLETVVGGAGSITTDTIVGSQTFLTPNYLTTLQTGTWTYTANRAGDIPMGDAAQKFYWLSLLVDSQPTQITAIKLQFDLRHSQSGGDGTSATTFSGGYDTDYYVTDYKDANFNNKYDAGDTLLNNVNMSAQYALSGFTNPGMVDINGLVPDLEHFGPSNTALLEAGGKYVIRLRHSLGDVNALALNDPQIPSIEYSLLATPSSGYDGLQWDFGFQEVIPEPTLLSLAALAFGSLALRYKKGVRNLFASSFEWSGTARE